MAYPMPEDSRMKNGKSIQYYSDEYDYPGCSTIANEKTSFASKLSKNFKNPSSQNCPIYVHEFPKTPNYSWSKFLEKKSSEKYAKAKITNSHKSKSMLDKLEETYWATWKPSKESNREKTFKKPYPVTKNGHGDVAETLIKYFGTADFNTSSATVYEETDIENYEELVNTQREKIKTNTQQIQTDFFITEFLCKENLEPKTADTPEPEIKNSNPDEMRTEEPKSEELENDHLKPVKLEAEEPKPEQPTKEISCKKEKHVKKEKSASKKDKAKKEEKETEANKPVELADIPSDPKVIKHTDSYIINKKKQDEVNEPTFQQPKCIRLYRKPGTIFATKGGSYPLKSCLRKETTFKGNFRLGAPGSPLFVTASSFNKKYGR